MINQEFALHIKNFIEQFKSNEDLRMRSDFKLNFEYLVRIESHLGRLDSHLPNPTYQRLVSDKVEQLQDQARAKKQGDLFVLKLLKSILRQVSFEGVWPEEIIWPTDDGSEHNNDNAKESWITFIDHVSAQKYLIRTDDGWTGEININHFNHHDWRLKELKHPHFFETYELRNGRLFWSHDLSLSAEDIKEIAEQ